MSFSYAKLVFVIAKALPEANQITAKLVCFVVPPRNDEHKLCLTKQLRGA